MGDKGFSLISAGDWSKPLTKFIEAAERGFGALFEPYKIRRRAKAEADALDTRTEASIAAAEKMVRAQQRIAKTELRRQTNIESIVEKAINVLPEEVSEESVSDDWLARFRGASQDIGDEEVQRLWAKVLANETLNPGSFSFRSIEALRLMSREDAILFERMSNYVVSWKDEELHFVPQTKTTREYIASNGVSILQISHLISLGLLQDGLVQKIKGKGVFELHYKDRVYEVTNPFDTERSFMIWAVTSVGLELLRLCDTPADDEFIETLRSGLDGEELELGKKADSS